MRFSRLAVVLVPVTAALVIAAAPTVRKDPHGVYGIIDSVIFEPASAAPERVQLWGAFALADVVGLKDGKIDYIQIGSFQTPKRGYMYYTVNRRDEVGSRTEWAALKAVAGTGQLAAWGAHIPPTHSGVSTQKVDTAFARIVTTYNGRVRPVNELMAAPDTFPQRMRSTGVARRAPMMSAARLGFPLADAVRMERSVPPPPRD